MSIYRGSLHVDSGTGNGEGLTLSLKYLFVADNLSVKVRNAIYPYFTLDLYLEPEPYSPPRIDTIRNFSQSRSERERIGDRIRFRIEWIEALLHHNGYKFK